MLQTNHNSIRILGDPTIDIGQTSGSDITTKLESLLLRLMQKNQPNLKDLSINASITIN